MATFASDNPEDRVDVREDRSQERKDLLFPSTTIFTDISSMRRRCPCP